MFGSSVAGGDRQRRNVTVSGRRTSLSLEDSIWASLTEICDRERLSLPDLVTLVDQRRRDDSLASALRVFVLVYFRTLTDLRSLPAPAPRGYAEAAAPPLRPGGRRASDPLYLGPPIAGAIFDKAIERYEAISRQPKTGSRQRHLIYSYSD